MTTDLLARGPSWSSTRHHARRDLARQRRPSSRLLELARLRVAALLHDEVGSATRTPAAVAAGFDEDLVDALPSWPTDPRFTPTDRAALALAEQFVMDCHGITDAQVAEAAWRARRPAHGGFLIALALFDGFSRACDECCEGSECRPRPVCRPPSRAGPPDLRSVMAHQPGVQRDFSVLYGTFWSHGCSTTRPRRWPGCATPGSPTAGIDATCASRSRGTRGWTRSRPAWSTTATPRALTDRHKLAVPLHGCRAGRGRSGRSALVADMRSEFDDAEIAELATGVALFHGFSKLSDHARPRARGDGHPSSLGRPTSRPEPWSPIVRRPGSSWVASARPTSATATSSTAPPSRSTSWSSSSTRGTARWCRATCGAGWLQPSSTPTSPSWRCATTSTRTSATRSCGPAGSPCSRERGRWPATGPPWVFSSDPYAAELARRLGAACASWSTPTGPQVPILGHLRVGAAGRPPRLPGPPCVSLGGGDVADEVTPAPGWISKWWPSLVVAAVTAAAWFVLAPWDWSTVDAAGHERTGATGDAGGPHRRRPRSRAWRSRSSCAGGRTQLQAPLAGLGDVHRARLRLAGQPGASSGGNLWPLGLIGVVLPIGLLGTFGGSRLALRTIRACNREREQRGDGAEPDPPPASGRGQGARCAWFVRVIRSAGARCGGTASVLPVAVRSPSPRRRRPSRR